MSIEENLERIADALEALVVVASVADGSEAPAKAEKKAPAKKAAAKKSAAKKKAAAKKKPEPEDDDDDAVTREDVQTALVNFCKDGPGKGPAKDILEEFDAGSISTLDPEKYGEFVERLEAVAEAAE